MLLRVTRMWLLPCCVSSPEKESAPGAPERLRETRIPGMLTPLSDRLPGLSGGLSYCAPNLPPGLAHCPPNLPAGLAHCPPASPGRPSCGSLLGPENPLHCPPARPGHPPCGSLLGPDRLLHRPLHGLFGPCLPDRLLHHCCLTTALFTAAFFAFAAADFIGVGDGLDDSMGVGAGSIQPESDQLISMSCSSAIVASSGGCRGVTPAAGVWAGCARLLRR